uniref:hypothetical protein n=1 Tax=Navicula avium TaxID=2018708 RepID=UPI00218234A8|nr:hypothetical protein N4L39_pgp029 [Haslea avium]UVG41490.1 hypothetical protein [Haslea avium]
MIIKFLKYLERWERDQSSSFWLFTVNISFFVTTLFNQLNQPMNQFEHQTEAQTVIKEERQPQYSESCSNISNILKICGGDLGKGSSPGARAMSDSRKTTRKTTTNGSGGSGYAEAWSSNPSKRSRPAAANGLAQQFQTGPVEGGNGICGRFSAQPTPDPYNPGCTGGPRSITVLSQSRSSEQDSGREIVAHDGVKGKLTDKSANHLTSKHGDVLGIDDPLPPNPNQGPSRYEKTRTRINAENKEKFGDTLEEILQDRNSETFPDVSMRGTKGHGYHTENYGESGFFVGIHTEGQFEGQIKKAQPTSEQQLEILRRENRID